MGQTARKLVLGAVCAGEFRRPGSARSWLWLESAFCRHVRESASHDEVGPTVRDRLIGETGWQEVLGARAQESDA